MDFSLRGSDLLTFSLLLPIEIWCMRSSYRKRHIVSEWRFPVLNSCATAHEIPRAQEQKRNFSYQRNVSTIIFLGFHNLERFNLLLFIFVLLIYCVTICGNLLIITLVSYSKTLHTPMYFFLTQLSVADVMLSTDIAPNMLKIFLQEKTAISFPGCVTQFYFFGLSEASECLLLMMMSYDRYLAICSPLHYASMMNQALCAKLILTCWLAGCCVASISTHGVCQLQFCGPNVIDHFFCDFTPLAELSCADATLILMEATLLSFPVVVIPFVVIAGSYTKIVRSILKISSSSGRMKSFSTCSSHLTVVSIFYGTLTATYMLPNKKQSQMISRALAMLYTVFTPFFNPIIYSLRNKDIKHAFRGVLLNRLTDREQKIGTVN
ncbi:olfactory receptor 10A7-like [Gastrophryne carolinensis]